MPLYEYDCPDCGRFEALQRFSDEPLKCCPACEKKGKETPVVRVVSAPSFQLKGTGWYKTDYSSGKSNGSNGSSSKSTPATGKPAVESPSEGGAKSGSGDSGNAKAATTAAA